MEIFDNIANSIKKKQEDKKALQAKQEECNRDKSIFLQITFGNKELNLYNTAMLRQKLDGTTYFNYNDDITYKLIGYEWDGALYQQVVDIASETSGNSTSNTVKKGKSGKMAAGAIVGTMLMPGIGTAVGAAIGAGGKSKAKTIGNNNSNTNTKQISKNIEQNSTAIIKLKRLSDNTVHSLVIVCNTNVDSQLRCFSFEQETNMINDSKSEIDSLNEIKALKELLDMGAITEQEFIEKKNRLLNLK